MSRIAPKRPVGERGLLDILGMTSDEFVTSSFERGIPRGRALQAYRTLFREGRLEGDWFGIEDNWRSPRAICAGYRYLTSLPLCPRSMRLPMHADLFAKRDM